MTLQAFDEARDGSVVSRIPWCAGIAPEHAQEDNDAHRNDNSGNPAADGAGRDGHCGPGRNAVGRPLPDLSSERGMLLFME